MSDWSPWIYRPNVPEGLIVLRIVRCWECCNIYMSIIYAVVVRQEEDRQVTLCSYDAAHGNYPTITENILKNVMIVDKVSYRYSNE